MYGKLKEKNSCSEHHGVTDISTIESKAPGYVKTYQAAMNVRSAPGYIKQRTQQN